VAVDLAALVVVAGLAGQQDFLPADRLGRHVFGGENTFIQVFSGEKLLADRETEWAGVQRLVFGNLEPPRLGPSPELLGSKVKPVVVLRVRRHRCFLGWVGNIICTQMSGIRAPLVESAEERGERPGPT
jgi:hypothetical protein